MKAYRLTHTVKDALDLVIADQVSKPELSSNPQDLVIKNTCIGVNFIDIYHRIGHYPAEFPFILGTEAVGVVEQIHPDAQHGLNIGDRVAYIAPRAYAEYTLVNAQTVVKVPSAISDQVATAVLVQGATALANTTKSVQVEAGDWVMIHAAAGGTGGCFVQLCKAFGAHVIGTASTPEKCRFIKEELGADHALLSDGSIDLVSEVLALTKGKGVRIVFDGVGRATFNQSLDVLEPLGWFISFGDSSGSVEPFQVRILSAKNIRFMRTAVFSFWKDQAGFQALADRVFQLVQDGKLNVKIHATWSFDQAGQAHQALESRKTSGKLLLIP